MFMAAKISIIFQSSKLFRVKYANLGLSFNRCVIRQDFSQEKKSSLKFKVYHVYIHAFITSIKRTFATDKIDGKRSIRVKTGKRMVKLV